MLQILSTEIADQVVISMRLDNLSHEERSAARRRQLILLVSLYLIEELRRKKYF